MAGMRVFTLEQSRVAYRTDFVLYGIAVVALTGLILGAGPREQWPTNAACTLLGLSSWTLVEYVVHRFVLHGVEPFRTWHAAHHQRPAALIFAPTFLSATLIVALLFFPMFLLAGLWRASAVTLGVVVGYLGYAITHHAIHHWCANRAWLKRRKRWHALHHSLIDSPGRYGVTTEFWDRIFYSVDQPPPSALNRNLIESATHSAASRRSSGAIDPASTDAHVIIVRAA